MKKYDLAFRLKSSLVHTEESISNISNIYREKIFKNDICFDVPALHGNAVRGSFRNLGAEHLLKTVKIEDNTVDQDIFHFLFSGGHLEKIAVGVDLKAKKKLRELLPFLSIFGSAIGNEMLRGKLIVSSAIPKCSELNTGINSFYDMTSLRRYTRQDDAKMAVGEKYLDEKKELKTQMFYDVEVLNAGIVLDSFVILDSEDELEIQALNTVLLEFMKKPYLGGSSRVGHGECEFLNLKKEDLKNDLYLKHIKENKENIINYLQNGEIT